MCVSLIRMPRKYELKQRAEGIENTRRRIVEATVQLHEEVGPAATSISAIAERAGVGRLTVYRHFPDEDKLLEACRDLWLSINPPPDAEAWAAIPDPTKRLKRALVALYAYYGRTEAMWEKVLRDAEEMPNLADVLSGFAEYLTALREILSRGWGLPANEGRSLSAALGLVLSFWTWRSLSREEGLGDEKSAALATNLVQRLVG